jgi:hypothetical protein
LGALPEIYDSLKRIAGRSRLVSDPEVRSALRLNPAECEELLEQLVAAGILRRTSSSKGQTYYWLAGHDTAAEGDE